MFNPSVFATLKILIFAPSLSLAPASKIFVNILPSLVFGGEIGTCMPWPAAPTAVEAPSTVVKKISVITALLPSVKGRSAGAPGAVGNIIANCVPIGHVMSN